MLIIAGTTGVQAVVMNDADDDNNNNNNNNNNYNNKLIYIAPQGRNFRGRWWECDKVRRVRYSRK